MSSYVALTPSPAFVRALMVAHAFSFVVAAMIFIRSQLWQAGAGARASRWHAGLYVLGAIGSFGLAQLCSALPEGAPSAVPVLGILLLIVAVCVLASRQSLLSDAIALTGMWIVVLGASDLALWVVLIIGACGAEAMALGTLLPARYRAPHASGTPGAR
jgi:hypothetical protein